MLVLNSPPTFGLKLYPMNKLFLLACTGLMFWCTAFSPISDFECKLFIPNVFSPNDDGVNDTFFVQSPCGIEDFEMTIFNRWGHQVFQSKSVEDHWDGKIAGKRLPKDVYTYFIRYRFQEDQNKEDRIATGDLSILY